MMDSLLPSCCQARTLWCVFLGRVATVMDDNLSRPHSVLPRLVWPLTDTKIDEYMVWESDVAGYFRDIYPCFFLVFGHTASKIRLQWSPLGISDRDNEEEIGDFFSQWGLVALVYRDQGNWGTLAEWPSRCRGCDAKTKRRNTQRMQFRGYRYRGLVICVEDNDYIKLFSSEPCNFADLNEFCHT